MEVKNTSDFNTKVLRELISVSKGSTSLKKVSVHFKNARSSTYRGMCYYEGCNWSRTRNPLITIGVNPKNKYPMDINKPYNRNGVMKRTRFPQYIVNNWKEMMVSIIAHEIRHLHFHRKDKPQSEVKCERFALKRVEKLRETKLKPHNEPEIKKQKPKPKPETIMRRRVMDYVKFMGVKIEVTDVVEIFARDGYTFDGDIHSMVCVDWDDAMHRLLESKHEKCEIENCEVCEVDTR